MIRLDLLLNAYRNYDTIYLGLFLMASWVAGAGQLLEWITTNRGKILNNIFWALILVAYAAGIIYVGLVF
jgi:hypothetical protein